MKTVMTFHEKTPRTENMQSLLNASHVVSITVLTESVLNLDVYFKTLEEDDNRITEILVYSENVYLGSRTYVNGRRRDSFTKMSKDRKGQTDIERLLISALEASHDRLCDMTKNISVNI